MLEQRPVGSDHLSPVSVERAFLIEGIVRVKAERLGPACCRCSTNIGPRVAMVGEGRGKVWEGRSEKELEDHVRFKLQQQPRLQILYLSVLSHYSELWFYHLIILVSISL